MYNVLLYWCTLNIKIIPSDFYKSNIFKKYHVIRCFTSKNSISFVNQTCIYMAYSKAKRRNTRNNRSLLCNTSTLRSEPVLVTLFNARVHKNKKEKKKG
ncbi:hypothetical protein QTP88_020034 [Uroleucon formosanum]